MRGGRSKVSLDHRLLTVHLWMREHPDQNAIFACETEQRAEDAARLFRERFKDHYGGIHLTKPELRGHKGRVDFVGLDVVNGMRVSHIFTDDMLGDRINELKVPGGSTYAEV